MQLSHINSVEVLFFSTPYVTFLWTATKPAVLLKHLDIHAQIMHVVLCCFHTPRLGTDNERKSKRHDSSTVKNRQCHWIQLSSLSFLLFFSLSLWNMYSIIFSVFSKLKEESSQKVMLKKYFCWGNYLTFCVRHNLIMKVGIRNASKLWHVISIQHLFMQYMHESPGA